MPIETLYFTSIAPAPTQHLSVAASQQALYVPQYNGVVFQAAGAYIGLQLDLTNINLAGTGVTLNLLLGSENPSAYPRCPLSIIVNGQNIVINWDGTLASYNTISWAIPPSVLNQGVNAIILTVSAGSSYLVIQEATAMIVQMNQQANTNWCWASVTESISYYYNINSAWIQCAVVNQCLGLTICCNAGAPAACNQPYYLDRALTLTGNFRSLGPPPVHPGDIQAETNTKHVFGVRIGWPDLSGHFIVASGISQDLNWVAVEDPWDGQWYVSYATLMGKYKGIGSWTYSYLTKSA